MQRLAIRILSLALIAVSSAAAVETKYPSVATRAGGVVASGPVGQKRRTDCPNTVRRNLFTSLNVKIPIPYV